MKMNVEKCNPRPNDCEMTYAKVDWTELDFSEKAGDKPLSETEFDVLIGTDVVYWPKMIIPLVETLTAFFDKNPGLVFYICYIERHSNTHKSLLKALAEANFKVAETGQEISKPINADSYIYKITRD